MKTASIPEDLAVRAEMVRHNVAKNLSDLLESQRWSRRAAALELGLTHTYVNSRASGATELSSSYVDSTGPWTGQTAAKLDMASC